MDPINNPLPQQPQPAVVSAAPPPPKSKTIPMVLGGIVLLIIGLFGGYFLANQQKPPDISVPVSPPPSTTENQQAVTTTTQINTYTYKSFSFTYPESWTVSDTSSHPILSTRRFALAEKNIVIENDDFLVYIGIFPSSTNQEAGGIFVNPKDLQDYKTNTDLITLGDGEFHLSKNHASLSDFTSPGTEAGIFAMASLSEFIPKKVTNNQNITYDGFDDLIKNKNGYSYIIAKFSKQAPAGATPVAVQNDIKTIVSSITW